MSRPTGPPAPRVPTRLRAHSDHTQRLSHLATGRPGCAGVWAGRQGPRAHLACARAPTPLPPGVRRAQAPGPWEGAAPEQRPGARWLPTSRNAGPCRWAVWHLGPARPSAPAPTFPTPTLPYPLHPLPLPPPAPPTPQSFLPPHHSSPTLPSPTFSYPQPPTPHTHSYTHTSTPTRSLFHPSRPTDVRHWRGYLKHQRTCSKSFQQIPTLPVPWEPNGPEAFSAQVPASGPCTVRTTWRWGRQPGLVGKAQGFWCSPEPAPAHLKNLHLEKSQGE
ncbi:B-cell CLL/lymphoma 7 protein family member C isoform X1 [Manis pentadactyla]|uniref:B-cell CLL/lymphoma 7 protein family member C isoform X1 n=1 Tax=Manis pentadactyla TaxID=143292 RepID=UPI00255C8801|nr:B-cell CLL/lymphoma 7 protein family member C isoform X1 [Manis pentadactyla]